MQNLLVLGQVPFTNIYINFWGWLMIVIIGAPLIVLYHRRDGIPAWLLSIYVAWLIRHHKLGYQI